MFILFLESAWQDQQSTILEICLGKAGRIWTEGHYYDIESSKTLKWHISSFKQFPPRLEGAGGMGARKE